MATVLLHYRNGWLLRRVSYDNNHFKSSQDAARPLGANGDSERVQHGVDRDLIGDTAPLPCDDFEIVNKIDALQVS